MCVDVRAIHPAALAATKSCTFRLQMLRQTLEKIPEGVKRMRSWPTTMKLTIRPSAVPAIIVFSKSLPMNPVLCVPSVSTPPGAIALTRIFRGPNSAASPRVIASTAPLVPE